MDTDPFNLQRFLNAQQPALYRSVIMELTAGRKRNHWMWFIFPEFYGVEDSEKSIYYAIKSSAEARAYLEHPVLGERLRECTELALWTSAVDALEIFGHPDDVKFIHSMTMFAQVVPAEQLKQKSSLFHQALRRFNGSIGDPITLHLMDGK